MMNGGDGGSVGVGKMGWVGGGGVMVVIVLRCACIQE